MIYEEYAFRANEDRLRRQWEAEIQGAQIRHRAFMFRVGLGALLPDWINRALLEGWQTREEETCQEKPKN